MSCDFITGGGKDGTVRLWRTTDEVQLVFNHSQGASIEALGTINAELFVTVGDNGQISTWSTRKKTPLCSLPLGMNFNLCPEKYNIRVFFRLAHGIDETNLTPRWISSLAVLPCSDLIATGSHDGFVKLWKIDAKSKKIEPVKEIPIQGFVNDLKFSSDGQFLIACLGQEHRLGRWWRIKEAKNQLMYISLSYEDGDKD